MLASRPVSSNPLYLLFNTPPTFGPLFLRLSLVALFFYQGTTKAFGWFGGDGWHETISAWTDPNGVNLSQFMIITIIVAELLIAVSLFFGLFTRISGLLVVLIMGGALYYRYGGHGFDAVQLPIVIMASGMALLFMGGGYLSMDRSIGRNLLPYIG